MSITDALEFLAVWFVASIPAALLWGLLLRHVNGDCDYDDE